MRRFVSVGFNCEFGFAQRYCGAEPVGDLLRWASTPWRILVDLLDRRFEGVGDDLTLRFDPGNPQYFVVNKRYGFQWHSWVNEGEMAPEALLRRESARLRRTAEAFIETLTEASRIFVRIPAPGETLEHAEQILASLRRYGPATLLVVMEDVEKSGQIDSMAPGLLRGWVSEHSHRIVQHVHTDQWLALCRRAVEIIDQPPPASQTRHRTDGPVRLSFMRRLAGCFAWLHSSQRRPDC